MPKHLGAVLIIAGFSFVVAGCDDVRGYAPTRGVVPYLDFVTAPIWVPIGLIDSADRRKAREAATERCTAREAQTPDKLLRGAEQGSQDAQISLGLAYQNGEGVAQDKVQADTWYLIAARPGGPIEQIYLAIRHRDAIEANMTPEQIGEAQECAWVWKPKP